MKSVAYLSLAILLASCEKPVDDDTDSTPDECTAPVDDWTIGEVVDTEGCGVMAKIDNAPWGGPLWVMRVEGDHYEMGYQYGRLAGPQLMELWWTYMGSLGAEMGLDAESADTIIGGLLDNAWGHYEPNVPQIFFDEFEGVADGMEAAEVEYHDDLQKVPIRLITLIDLAMSSQLDFGNLGGLSAFLQTGYTEAILDYYGMGDRRDADGEYETSPPLLQCSYFAAWGDRTEDGGLYMTRNMDFSADTGIYTHAMITAFVPDDGVPYVSISWLGATLGVLAGISEEGLAISAVGSESPYERITTEPALLRAREALEFSADVDDAMPYLLNDIGDGINRAPTIGYNALLSWGDPRGSGADAQSVILESNGLETGVFHHKNDCSVEASLVRYDYDGVATVWTATDHPDEVNSESEAQEIDGDGNVRLFAHDGQGNLLTNQDGKYYEDPVDGIPIQTGYPEDCALYRGDEAMAYGVRIHQAASNGPMRGDGTGLMVDSGSWQKRYWPMRQMTVAYAEGTSYEWKGEEVIPDNAGQPMLIGLDEAEAVSRVAAMDSNVWDVVYDTTNLKVRLSFESGTGDNWIPAHEQPPFLEIDLKELFLTE